MSLVRATHTYGRIHRRRYILVTLPEAIRRRTVMYIGTTVEPLANIIEEITGQFIHLGVSKHRIRTDADFIMIEAKEDWLVADKKDHSFADPFNEWVRQYSDHGKNVNLGPRGEVTSQDSTIHIIQSARQGRLATLNY